MTFAGDIPIVLQELRLQPQGKKLQMPPNHESISVRLRSLYERTVLMTQRFTSGKFWVLKVLLLCVFFSIFLSGGLDFNLFEGGNYPESYFKKIDHPLLDVTKIYALNSHDSNMNFRLTVPVILHVLGIHWRWTLPLLTIAATCLILVLSCMAACRLTGDRVCGCFIALNVAATYVGSFNFIAYYDAIAICQLALAGLPGMPWWGRGLLVFTASFTDERAFVASGLLLVASFFLSGQRTTWLARLRNPDFLAVGFAMFAYGVARLALIKFGGLSQVTGATGPGALVGNFIFLHPSVWFSLEGGWLLFLLAMGVLFARGQFFEGATFVLATLFYLAFALMIGDVMRSTVFIFPMLFICLKILQQNEPLPGLRIYCLLAFLISAIGGNYNVYVGKITWFQPLLIHWIQAGAGVIYDWIYPLLPHTMPRQHG